MALHRPDDPTPYYVLGSTLSEGEQGRRFYDQATAASYEHQSYAQAVTAAFKLTHEFGNTGV